MRTGIDINSVGEDGRNSLHVALNRRAEQDVIEFLIDKGANVSALGRS